MLDDIKWGGGVAEDYTTPKKSSTGKFPRFDTVNKGEGSLLLFQSKKGKSGASRDKGRSEAYYQKRQQLGSKAY